jgi:putative MATE family efflux protein
LEQQEELEARETETREADGTGLQTRRVDLSEKDRVFREFAINGNMWKLIFKVCTPLAVFQFINHIFNILDTMMASHISADAVSAVAYLSQLQSLVAAVGTGLAIGGSLKISTAYGAGDYGLVKKRVSTLVCLCMGFGLVVLMALPFIPQILRLANTPEEFITIGSQYFTVTLGATVINFINNVYIAIERARGKTKRIMYLNLMIIVLKLSITAVFIYVLNAGVVMIAAATLISQLVLLLFAIRYLVGKKDAFGFQLRFITFKKIVIAPMIQISIPVIAEKAAFAMGKTVINSMSKNYGPVTVGALGISNNICGTTTSLQNGIQDGGASIISQNAGAGRSDRIWGAFWRLAVFNVAVGIVGYSLINIFLEPISYLFANSREGLDVEFQQMIMKVCRYDSLGGCIPLGLNSAIMALFLGLGYTKLTLLCNFCRVFVFRIPVLWGLQHFTELGSESVGIVMMVSNIATTMMSVVTCFFVSRFMKRHPVS